ncbi:MAG: response regulator [Bacteroidota bacterium]|nr:response regulator [Bacteroidota bacterium]
MRLFNFVYPIKSLKYIFSNMKDNLSPFDSKNKWKDKVILIVEDNETSYFLLNEILEETGAQLLRAENGEEALEVVKKRPEINLVIMDILLPVMNGIDATKQIKQIRKDLPVIAQTANAMSDDRSKYINAGCDDYIAKPINLNEFMQIISRFLN